MSQTVHIQLNFFNDTFVFRRTTIYEMIQVKNLTKYFNDVKAVDELSFSVKSGEVYGFLGQNGAGKSTTIRMLLSLITPTSGTIEIFGKELLRHRKEILSRTGAIIEKPDLYKYFTALENLQTFAIMSGNRLPEKKLMEQLHKVGLADRAKSKVKTYSQGMKQRLGIAIALVHDPELIILDEPINGLDPQGIADVRKLILHLSRDLGKTIFISSHLLSEMELVADSMLIIDKGKKVAEGKMNELFDPAATIAELKTTDDQAAFEKLQHLNPANYTVALKDGCILLQLHRNDIPGLVKQLVQMEIGVISLNSKHSLEDYFLKLTSGN